MSIKVMSYVWEHSQHQGSVLLTLLAIADYADDEGTAYPKIGMLAAKTRMSERNVQRALKTLEDSAELVLTRNAGPHGAHIFSVVLPGVTTCRGDNLSGVTTCRGDTQGSPGVTPRVKIAAPPSLSPSDSPSSIPPVPDPSGDPSLPPLPPRGGKRTKASKVPVTEYTPGFQLVWHAYPPLRHERKVATFAIWVARGLEPRAAEIAEKLERLQCTLWAGRDKAYIPLPTTWLNDARYEDPLVPLEVAHEQELKARLSDREYQNIQAGKRFLEHHHAQGRPRTVSDGDAEALGDIQYRIE